MPKAVEVARLVVNGQNYEDWETVLVRQTIHESPAYKFRFTCSEGIPLVKDWAKLRIKPGDWVQVYLAGILAITGRVISRQVYYDAHRHHIEIQGGGAEFVAAQTSIVHKTGEENNVTLEQVTRKFLAPLKIPLKIEGIIPSFKFRRVSVAPHQYVYDAIEHLARSVGVAITSNPQGEFVLLGDKQNEKGADLVEGKNILEGREIVSNEGYSNVYGTSSHPGDDGQNMTKVAHEMFYQGSLANQKEPLTSGGLEGVLAEVPIREKDLLKARVGFEGGIIDKDKVQVWITVQGWLSPSGGLWGPPPKDYTVWSPMLILRGSTLQLKAINYTQDNQGGSRSTLELVNKIAAGAPYSPIQGPGTTGAP